MKTRHQAQLEVSQLLTVDEKIVFLNAVKTELNLTFTDVISEVGNPLVSMHFSTTDGDSGRIQMFDNTINIYVSLDFTRLINLHTFTKNYFTKTIVDLVATYGEKPVAEEPKPEIPSA